MKFSAFLIAFSFIVFPGIAQVSPAATTEYKNTAPLPVVPAPDSTTLRTAMEATRDLGPEGWKKMARELRETPQGSDTMVAYLLGGFSRFAAQPGKSDLKARLAQAYVAVLPEIRGKGNLAFLLRQLEITGDDRAIPRLRQYLGDDTLADPAARALVRIGTPAAGKALLDGLKATPAAHVAVRATLTEALGDLRYVPAAAYFSSRLKGTDGAGTKALLYGLASTGDAGALPLLAAAAKTHGYSFDSTGATAAYLHLLRRLAASNDPAADRAASALMRQTSEGPVQTHTAALTLLVKMRKEKGFPLLTEAMRDPNGEYRIAALKLAASFPGGTYYSAWQRIIATAGDTVRAEIATMLGDTHDTAAFGIVTPLLTDTSVLVRAAAIRAAGRTGRERALPALLGLLEKDAPAGQDAVRQALLTLNAPGLAAALGTALDGPSSAGGRAVLIDVLAARGATAQREKIWPLLSDTGALVRRAAFASLAALSLPEDLDRLGSLLAADTVHEEIVAVQEGMLTALRGMPDSISRTNQLSEEMQKAPPGRQVLFLDVLTGLTGNAGAPYSLTPSETEDGFELLFDGVHMDQWTGNLEEYVPEDGAISLKPKKGAHGNLYTKKEYADFIYRFQFSLYPGSNNGIGIRAPLEGDAAYVGMEIQVLDNEAAMYRDLHDYQYHGSVYGVLAAKRGFLKPTGEWNEEEITARGNRIKVVLNGMVILNGDISAAIAGGTPDKRDHPGLKNKTGHLGFLGHGDKVKFRNLRVRPLP